MSTEAFREARGDGAARLAAEIAEAERQERERLAEALHDDALQRLLVARQDLAEAGEDPTALRAVEGQLGELTESLRGLTRAMHEHTLAAMPLGQALERLAEDGARRGRLVVHTHVDPAATGDHDPFVLGVTRELLTNVVKHANAATADVAVTAGTDAVIIRVSDDGRGIAPEEVERAAAAGHLGHARLRRSLASIGGTLEIESGPLAGTTVTCVLPLENLQAQRALEDALRRERRWSAALVAAMQDGFVVFRDELAVQVNDRLCDMTGFAQEELVGAARDAAPFWPADERARFDALVRDAQPAGGADTQVQIQRRDGSRFPGLVAARAIQDGEGGQAGILVTVKDITALELAAERRRLELELSTVVATTNRLRGLLDAARSVTGEAGLEALLQAIARTIAEDLGWAVVINLYRPAWDDFVVASTHGLAPEAAAALDGVTYQWAEWTPRLDDRFERRGAYVVPAPGHGDGAGGAWQVRDEVLIPFRHSLGHFLGILSLSAPRSGRRPSDAELDVLVGIADHAALAVQQAQTAIDAARHAAALDRLLHVSPHIAATQEIEPMLDVVAEAIAEALGFGRVLVETLGSDGLLRPRATHEPALEPGGMLVATGLDPAQLATLLDPSFCIEGCFLLGRDEADERMPPARRTLLASRANGRGWRAWDDHVLLVPLHGAQGKLVGAVWVDDPVDRLLPGEDRLKALHAFAEQATAAMTASDRYLRLESVSEGDPLTSLGNRRSFLRELVREAARTARSGGSATVVLALVEGRVDEPGADPATVAGAPALPELAAVFEAELRRHDRAFRIDGTLFALLLTGGEQLSDTTAVTARLAARMRALGAGGDLRVHVGTATMGALPEGPDAVLHRAADALLAVRRMRAGGDGYV